jgi:hypothetical protein
MNMASSQSLSLVAKTCARLESLLKPSPAYRRIEDGLYVVKQGSSLVMISVHPWKEEHVVIRLTAQLVQGVTMSSELALELLEMNATLRFGAFAFVPAGDVVAFVHTLLDRALSDEREFRATLAAFALIADEYDNRIADRYGGSTMADLLEEQTIQHLRSGWDTKGPLSPA